MIRFTTLLIFASFAIGLGIGAIAVAATSGIEAKTPPPVTSL